MNNHVHKTILCINYAVRFYEVATD